MRFSFAAALVLGLSAESAIASSWFGKAGKLVDRMTVFFIDIHDLPCPPFLAILMVSVISS